MKMMIMFKQNILQCLNTDAHLPTSMRKLVEQSVCVCVCVCEREREREHVPINLIFHILCLYAKNTCKLPAFDG